MTEQEAETLAERLTRIWGRDGAECPEVTWSLGTWGLDEQYFVFNLKLPNLMEFSIYREGEWVLDQLDSTDVQHVTGALIYWPHDKSIDVDSATIHVSYLANQETFDAFAAQWMPYFRRGLWLSGCAIEASAHEKAEWLQGFSQEELQAWNLKM